jgi:multidrug efflux system outer membrane protein
MIDQAFKPIAAALAALLLAGCTVGPDYVRPEAELPQALGVPQAAVAAADQWWKLFQDPVLDKLVEETLAYNRDLRAAAERIEQARAQLGLARAEQWPEAGLEYTRSRNRTSAIGGTPLPEGVPLETSSQRLVLRASWEIDFWGKYRRSTEAARAELAATEAGRDAIRATLVADTIRGYFALRGLDASLASVTLTRQGREKSLELQKLRLDAGVVSELEYRQVESDVNASAALVAVIRQRRVAREGALALLLGRSPRAVFEDSVERGNPVTPSVVEVPAGLPSDILLKRPDVREAERRLAAANARIGVARADYFPRISLTGFFGGESQSLGDLFDGQARTWNLAGAVLQPLIAAGRIRSNEELAEARTREAAELYQKAVANAFREVREALAAQSNLREAYLAMTARERALSRTAELSRLRYDNGAVSLFDVLETERQLQAAKLETIDAERDRRNAIVDLYLALGA